jgi:hypothetical protein
MPAEMTSPRFYAVSDESQITADRFRSIAAVSLPVDAADRCNAALRVILAKYEIAEFKWHELKNAKRRFCALALVDWVFDALLACDGRIDVLIWDTRDSRHSILGRNDDKNFERMYFHLHKALMRRRPPESSWHLRPDERLGIDWQTLQDCLASVGAWRTFHEKSLLADGFSLAHFHLRTLKQVRSCDQPLCQLADLFAGVAAYTRSKPAHVEAWSLKESGQISLFEASEPSVAYSGRDKERLPVVLRLGQRAKALGLGVSLNTTGYLRTLDPTNPLNFWHYVPQHPADRAPTVSGP